MSWGKKCNSLHILSKEHLPQSRLWVRLSIPFASPAHATCDPRPTLSKVKVTKPMVTLMTSVTIRPTKNFLEFLVSYTQ